MNRRSLRNLTRERTGKDDIRRVAAELRMMEDRPAAIVAATLVEDALEDRILSMMRKLSKSEYADLFLNDGPLATFAAKIRVASALRLVYKDWTRQIQAVKSIRNAFAHARTHLDFATPEIVDHTKQITVVDEHRNSDFSGLWKGSNFPLHQVAASVRLHDPRSRYVGSCIFISFTLWHVGPDPDFLDDEEDEPE